MTHFVCNTLRYISYMKKNKPLSTNKLSRVFKYVRFWPAVDDTYRFCGWTKMHLILGKPYFL